MTDEQIIKALECCSSRQYDYCDKCDFKPKENIKGTVSCCMELMRNTLDLINRQQTEIDNLTYTLWGVMHFVDKWLDGDELKQDEVNRAATMREKTLQIAEEKQEKIERLQNDLNVWKDIAKRETNYVSTAKSEAIKEFVKKLKKRASTTLIATYPDGNERITGYQFSPETIDDIVKEMVGDNRNE